MRPAQNVSSLEPWGMPMSKSGHLVAEVMMKTTLVILLKAGIIAMDTEGGLMMQNLH